jgi:hypothetical protein
MRAEFEVRKISNGYILRINGKEIFCDTPEAICGETSTWVLDGCKALDVPRSEDDEFAAAFNQMQAQVESDIARSNVRKPTPPMSAQSSRKPFRSLFGAA